MVHAEWDDDGEPAAGLRQALEGPFDALRGPPPRQPRIAGTPRPHLAWPGLALRAVGWSLALALLAPLTVLVLSLSGLAADDAEPVDAVDLGFYVGFVPLSAAIVVGLLSLNHWPLRDLRGYHGEVFVALVLVAVPLLVELRILTADVAGGSSGELSLFVNGSLAIQALLAYWVVRYAARNLAEVHARNAGWRHRQPGRPEALPPDPGDPAGGAYPLPADTPRYGATTALALYGLVWGIGIAAAAGASAGTLVVPVTGTLVGAYFGAIYGLVPACMGALWVLVTVTWRRDTDPAAVYVTVRLALVAVGLAVLVGLWPSLEAATYTPSHWEDAHLVRTWLIVVPVVVLLLRKAAPHLAATYVRRVAEPERE